MKASNDPFLRIIERRYGRGQMEANTSDLGARKVSHASIVDHKVFQEHDAVLAK